jgi:hypothetical protein
MTSYFIHRMVFTANLRTVPLMDEVGDRGDISGGPKVQETDSTLAQLSGGTSMSRITVLGPMLQCQDPSY